MQPVYTQKPTPCVLHLLISVPVVWPPSTFLLLLSRTEEKQKKSLVSLCHRPEKKSSLTPTQASLTGFKTNPDATTVVTIALQSYKIHSQSNKNTRPSGSNFTSSCLNPSKLLLLPLFSKYTLVLCALFHSILQSTSVSAALNFASYLWPLLVSL